MINSLRPEDYLDIAVEVESVKAIHSVLLKEGIRSEIGHPNRFWEYGSALKLCPHKASVLDVGSGFSPLGPALAIARAAQVTECEPDAAMIAIRQPKLNQVLTDLNYQRITYLNTGTEQLPETEFDLVTCISVLEHVNCESERNSWLELARRVKIGGILFITVDCVPVSHPYGFYHYDELRKTNFTPADIFERFHEICATGFIPEAEVDWNYNGDQVFNYTFFRMGLRRFQ